MAKHDDSTEKDTGILGLGSSVVPKEPGDPSTSNDEESVEKRRHRIANAELEEFGTTREDPDRQRSGATGIDMGAGGQGTHINRKK